VVELLHLGAHLCAHTAARTDSGSVSIAYSNKTGRYAYTRIIPAWCTATSPASRQKHLQSQRRWVIDDRLQHYEQRCMMNVGRHLMSGWITRGLTVSPGSHPLLQQTPLSVSPFIDLPKPPTLPHNYASLPSTLPPSSIHAPPAPSNSDLPAYVTSSSGFAAHPLTIIAQNKSLLEQLGKQRTEAQQKVKAWEQSIKDRELAEKRRKAPGWLDSEQHLLQPEKTGQDVQREQQMSLIDDPEPVQEVRKDRSVDDLGDAMDRAFGRSEMG